jgi:hypothetical protein
MAEMTKRLVFPSSFDSTRYTAVDPKDDHPNLAQAQAEAVTTLLLGRPLGLTNTYAFDSRTVLNLVRETLLARKVVRETSTTAAEREHIDNADPFKLRWYAPTPDQTDFLSCSAEQLLRLQGQRRFILSAWKQIDGNDQARTDLANALTADRPRFPGSLRELDSRDDDGAGELEQSFETLIMLDEYCRGRRGRSDPSGKSHISLLEYVQDFEGLDSTKLERVMDGKIDIDTVMHLRESIGKQPENAKGARSWAHQMVEAAGGEEHCGDFLLQQRQLIDTLYNEVLADSVGSNHDLLSSVPRTVGNEKLEQVNAFALNLIRFSKQRHRAELATAGATEVPASYDPATDMSEVFVAASAAPELPASPVGALLVAYWQLLAEEDTWRAWQASCDQLEDSLNTALRRRAAGQRAGSQLSDAWEAHLDMLQDQLPHVRTYEGSLATTIELSGKDYCTLTGFLAQAPAGDRGEAGSLAAGEYIDRYLRNVVR